MKKILYIGTCVFIAITMISIIGLMYLTWNQYDDTRQWDNSTFEGNMSDIPPELAKNYTNVDNKETLTIWAKVNESIDTIDKQGGITEDTFEGYRDIYDKAMQKQTDYKLQDGNVVQSNKQLQLYLDIFSFTQEAYTIPDSNTLQKLSGQLETLMMVDDHTVNSTLHTQLGDITTHYRALASFIEHTLPILGIVDTETLTANIDLTSESTNTILQEIDTNGLTVFPYMKRLQSVLKDDTWSHILVRNTITQNFHKWQTEKAILEVLQKSDYYSVLSITTLQQAKDAGIVTPEKERDGYTIDMNSSVTVLTYEGQMLQSTQYIKKGTPVIATVDVRYVKIPEEPSKPNVDEPSKPDKPSKPNVDKPSKPNTDKPNIDKPNTDKPNIDKPNTDKPNERED